MKIRSLTFYLVFESLEKKKNNEPNYTVTDNTFGSIFLLVMDYYYIHVTLFELK